MARFDSGIEEHLATGEHEMLRLAKQEAKRVHHHSDGTEPEFFMKEPSEMEKSAQTADRRQEKGAHAGAVQFGCACGASFETGPDGKLRDEKKKDDGYGRLVAAEQKEREGYPPSKKGPEEYKNEF